MSATHKKSVHFDDGLVKEFVPKEIIEENLVVNHDKIVPHDLQKKDLMIIKKSCTTSKSTEISILSAESDYSSYIMASRRTVLHETDSSFSYGIGSNDDLIVIKRSGTGSQFTEVHVVSALEDYLHTTSLCTSILPETDTNFAFLVASNSDIYAIHKGETPSNHLELAVLSAVSNFKTYFLQKALPIPIEADYFYDFALSTNHDLYIFKTYAKELLKNIELSILSAASFYAEFTIRSHSIPLGEIGKVHTYCITSNYDIIAIKRYCLSTDIFTVFKESDYQSFSMQTSEALPDTDSNLSFDIGFNNDLIAIKSTRTKSRKIEIIKLSQESSYNEAKLVRPSVAYQRTKAFAFGANTDRDLVVIKKLGNMTRKTEVHILTAASDYQSFIIQAVTTLDESDDATSFCVAPNNDLFAITMWGTASNATEVSVLSAASEYKEVILHSITPLHDTNHSSVFCLGPNLDLYIIQRSVHGCKKTKLMILSSQSKYETVTLHTATVLPESDETFNFLVNPNGDLIVIQKANTKSKFVEILVLSASSSYQSIVTHTITTMSEMDSTFEFALV